jgi:formylglycine-generating enzyme required for sulfatase activity
MNREFRTPVMIVFALAAVMGGYALALASETLKERSRAVQGSTDQTITLDLGEQVTMKLTLIPAGKFVMGSPSHEAGRGEDEGPQREVTISKPFYMGIHEITQGQYEVIMGSNPACFKGATRPVERVSWEDATEFCRRLSQKTGKKVTLPTEAQWEYACRAGSTTRFCFGDDAKQLAAYARYGQGVEEGTAPVGMGKPNAWGLYDMHGNVWEWCSDWYAKSYANLPLVDPTGLNSGQTRVLRGGCWYLSFTPAYCRSACRYDISPGGSGGNLCGFRVIVDSNAGGSGGARNQ